MALLAELARQRHAVHSAANSEAPSALIETELGCYSAWRFLRRWTAFHTNSIKIKLINPMKTKLISLLLFALVSRATFAVTISVPGTADLWLAGMPDGSTASFGDSAPGQSPVLVVGIPV